MFRWEVTAVKGFLAAVVSFAVYLTGLINEATVVLLFFMFLDMITGLLRAWMTKSLNSTLGWAGLIKKFAIFVVLAMTAGIEYFFIHMGQDTNGVIIMGVASFFIVNEGLSILENCAQMGLPIPPVLYNALDKLNRDPAGKEQALIRDPALEQVDKAILIKEIQQVQKENIQQDKKKEEC
ncbi:toxin secretion/phage lysis holin [Planomicrobium soli]|uniref:Toxin secretion/phage lysis holin n=1 Tax=Planomicrobium soli TaxID=1176648 RepID=A0A2P8H7D9_9BACL|nr:phage holin family protein [Planomicrobium soli]PSL42119.1 toxin secretion/phage lysis holin [Planomicrobium soli]